MGVESERGKGAQKAYVIRAGKTAGRLAEFHTIRAGDMVFHKKKPVKVQEGAHLSGDASYDGYLLYASDGEAFFPGELDAVPPSL